MAAKGMEIENVGIFPIKGCVMGIMDINAITPYNEKYLTVRLLAG